MTDPVVNIDEWFGHVELRSWLDYDASRARWIGMYECKQFDRYGILISHTVGPTGAEAWIEEPQSWWRYTVNRLLHRTKSGASSDSR
jgi:hypothetical protein